MDDRMYVVRLTEIQAAEIRGLLAGKGWGVELESLDRYLEKTEIAGDYVEVKQQQQQQQPPPPKITVTQNAFTPLSTESPADESYSPVLTRRTVRSETTKLVDLKDEHAVERFDAMRQIGSTYKNSFKGGFRSGAVRKDAPRSPERGKWHVSVLPGKVVIHELEPRTADIEFTHFLVADDNTIKVITKLSTEHVHSVSRVPVRIVLLVDRSGSMLHKIGRDSRHTKITKVKHFAKTLVESLDEDDEVGLVTFGEEAQVFFPLEKLTSKAKPILLGRLETLDKGSMSRQTNLSAGLRMALKVFYDASKCEADYLERKNSILVFSDGDINAGTTETNSLLHEVRQNIRQMVPKLDETQNQWVTISVVTTGSEVSEQAYMLSKTCSSEAYYYINRDAEDPEAELFLPVLLRKTAVAWNISLVVEAFHDIKFDDNKCSRDNRVRMRRTASAKTNAEKAFFMYDFAASHSRQIGVAATWNGEKSIEDLPNDEVLFKLRVEFTNIKGERLWQEQSITKEDVIDACQGRTNNEANAAACKHELQLISSDILRSAAEHVKHHDKGKSKDVLMDGQRSLQSVLEQFGRNARDKDCDKSNIEMNMYAKCVADNLGALINTIEESAEGVSWNKMKAVSTAIVRESPNVSDTVVDADILCPLPDIRDMGTSAMKEPLDRLMAKNKKRVSVGLDKLIEELQTSINKPSSKISDFF